MTARVSRIAESPGAAGPVLRAINDDEPHWRDFALCQEVDPELWFPLKGGSTREAKAICADCPVAEECLEYALENDERFGIFGGKSERERRRIKRERQQEAA